VREEIKLKENINEYVKELDDLIEKLWDEAPEEITVFNEPTYTPGYTRYIRITSANRLLSSVSSTLGMMKSCLSKGVNLGIVKEVTRETLEENNIFLKTVELHFTVDLIERFLELLGAMDDDEYVEVADRLSFYCKRVGPNGWIDNLYLKKAQMSMAYDLFFPPSF
jgi:hypothetical protein